MISGPFYTKAKLNKKNATKYTKRNKMRKIIKKKSKIKKR